MSERVLITGASRGIGHAIAAAFLERGAQTALAVRDAASAGVRELIARAPQTVPLLVDMRDRAAVETLVPRACDALGGLDVLVNCAGIVQYAAIDQLTAASVYEQFEVNCFAPTFIAQAAALRMKARGGGAIINVASTLGMKPAPLTAAYAASKAALLSFTRSLALELGGSGVRVNAVAPGIVETDMIRVQRPAAGGGTVLTVDEQLDVLRGLHVLGRLGTVEEVAQAVLYLADAKFVTGSVLTVDGGLLLT